MAPRKMNLLTFFTLVAIGVAVAAAYFHLVTDAREKHLIATGIDEEARVNDIWVADHSTQKGGMRYDRYVSLTWTDREGRAHQTSNLKISVEMFEQLKARRDMGNHNALLRYDPTGQISSPILVEEIPYRKRGHEANVLVLSISAIAAAALVGWLVLTS